jgi:hypothetical protein
MFIVGPVGAERVPQPHHLRNRALALASTKGAASADTRSRHARMLRSWTSPSHLTSAPPYTIYPGDYGADPTGRTDSTEAFQAALAALLSRNVSGHKDEGETVDLGGALLDLEGGDYLISSPLVIPSYFSNCAVAHGSLRASSTFPSSGFLVEIGSPEASCVNWGDSCNEDVSLEDLLFDGSQVAAGCVRYWAVIGVNSGPDLFWYVPQVKQVPASIEYCMKVTSVVVGCTGGRLAAYDFCLRVFLLPDAASTLRRRGLTLRAGTR